MDDNVLSFVKGGKPEADAGLPDNRYIIEDIEGEEYAVEGFLIFTSQHVAVMRDEGTGAIPVLVLPLNRLKVAELYDEDEDDVSPF